MGGLSTGELHHLLHSQTNSGFLVKKLLYYSRGGSGSTMAALLLFSLYFPDCCAKARRGSPAQNKLSFVERICLPHGEGQ